MDIFCCYAKQDVIDIDTKKPDSKNEFTKENDTELSPLPLVVNQEIAQPPSQLPLVVNQEIAQDQYQPLLEAEVKIEVEVNTETETEVAVDNFPIEEKDEEEEYGLKSEYIPVVYDSVTNTMEEFIEPQIPYNGNLQEGTR